MKLIHIKPSAALHMLGAASLLLVASCSNEPAAVRSDAPYIDAISNEIVISRDDELVWNGVTITLPQLKALLRQVAAMPDEPELQFRPDGRASYERSVSVLEAIKDSGVSNFGFVGNERYRVE